MTGRQQRFPFLLSAQLPNKVAKSLCDGALRAEKVGLLRSYNQASGQLRGRAPIEPAEYNGPSSAAGHRKQV
eukprot:scaffold9796_cov154-Ochromonas_danica.AAC.3